MSSKIGVIDVFAGPGGLGEGFSTFEAKPGVRPFQVAVSAEMERSAHATLRLRAFFRLLDHDPNVLPKPYADYLDKVVKGSALPPDEHFGHGEHRRTWHQANEEALNLTLGDPSHNELLYGRIQAAKRKYDALVLIGGPPCQAYSLVGRARQTNVPGFHTKGDKKHFLYREYLQILSRFSPDIFIMENVKGILTSSVGGRNMFERIRTDLAHPSRAVGRSLVDSNPEYILLPIQVPEGCVREPSLVEHDPGGFLIRSERHGIPQARHRIIVMGVRADASLVQQSRKAKSLASKGTVTVSEAVAGLPPLRSSVSRALDDGEAWVREVDTQRQLVVRALKRKDRELADTLIKARFSASLPRKSSRYNAPPKGFSAGLRRRDQRVVTGHESRSHMSSDLGRYQFVAAFAGLRGRSPNSAEFPEELAPDHVNWFSGAFADRFRAQIEGLPASTVTSHLSKDGHAFIHWDLAQCRSLSPREAARIQTFPDDYIFLGNRTQQYVQVGNAVPPLLAKQIAEVVWSILSGD